MFELGTVIAGKYRIERVLGRGGMGAVYAATHVHLGTDVALKFLHREMVEHASVVERFMREARASARLRSDHACRVSDVDMTDGVPFIVMELLAGQDLSRVLKQGGPMPIAMAADYVLQACAAIAEAHAIGIVHRDLKPGNLFLTQRQDGTPLIKVLDFGVAKAPDSVDFSLTQTASVVGSPGYMSPEQLRSSKAADARSDIWALGVVLYELVSGRQPFHGESITDLAFRVAMDPTPPIGGNVPPAFEAVIARCLEKDPARRFQDVAELAAAIAPFAGPRGAESAQAAARALRGAGAVVPTSPGTPPFGIPAHAPAPTPPTGPGTPTTLGSASGVVAGGARARSGWVMPAVIGGAAALGVAIVLVVSGGDDRGGTRVQAPAAGASAPAAAFSGTPTGDAVGGTASGGPAADPASAGGGEHGAGRDATIPSPAPRDGKSSDDATGSAGAQPAAGASTAAATRAPAIDPAPAEGDAGVPAPATTTTRRDRPERAKPPAGGKRGKPGPKEDIGDSRF